MPPDQQPATARARWIALPLIIALSVWPTVADAQAQTPQCKKSKALPNPNAHMSVSAWRHGQKPKTWSNVTYWCGQFGTFAAVRRAGSWQWTGDYQLVGIRVNTEDDGSKGIPLMKWIPRNTYKITVVIVQHGFGSNPVGGMGKTKRSKSNAAPRPPSTTTTPRLRRRERTRRYIPSVSTRGLDARRTKRAKASQTTPSATTANAERSPTAEPTFDNPQGRSEKSKSRHYAGAGSDKGRPDGDYSGPIGSKPEELGGVADAYGSTLTGQSFGDKEGAKGGEGSRGDAGARGAFALFGGILNVPRQYRAAVEVAILAGQAINPGTAYEAVVARGVRLMTMKKIRREIRREGRDQAKAYVKQLEREYADELAKMATKERAYLLKSTRQQYQHKFFEQVEGEAKRRKSELTTQIAKSPDDTKLKAQLDEATKIEEAASVRPVEGRFPLNHEYADKTYPMSNIDPMRYPDAIEAIKSKGMSGIQFTREGYPDFSPWIFKEGDVAADVRIKYRGTTRPADYTQARKAMREKLGDPTWREPLGYSWHHHEDVGRMMLIPRQLNDSIGHTGGIPHYRMRTGNYDAYR